MKLDELSDLSPPVVPSFDAQRDALQKGLGRALQWALTGRLGDEPLLEACLRDQRYDAQAEELRGNWLWSMIEALDAADRLRVPILHALYDLTDDDSVGQLCQLACRYAAAGDETVRTRLYEIVEQKPVTHSPWLGENEIIRLDGERAFLFAARVRGARLTNIEWDWDDGRLVETAIDCFGDARVTELLAASPDAAVTRFRNAWLEEKRRRAQRKQHRSRRETMRAVGLNEIVSAAKSESRCYWFRGWGQHADEAELRTVLRYLRAAREPRVIANLMKVFSARALPEFDTRLFELCRHADDEIRHWAFNALKQNAHPLIREFALAELTKERYDRRVFRLFSLNYKEGDEGLLIEAMDIPQDDWERHSLLMDIIEILEKNPQADCSWLGLVTYASTPCENCRHDAARLLHSRRVAPAWLTEECRYDSAVETRKLANCRGQAVRG
jgi:hypothetical protein